MKNRQDNISTLPALLHAAGSVDTLETNSLCCEAAGILAPSSATAGALIPHEKLRGAVLADATLNAQERPLAQPAVGYGGQNTKRWNSFTPLPPSIKFRQNLAQNFFARLRNLHMAIQLILIHLSKDPLVRHRILKDSRSVTDTPKRLQYRFESLLTNGLRYREHQSLMYALHSFRTNPSFAGPIRISTNRRKGLASFFYNSFSQQNRLDLSIEIGFFQCTTLKFVRMSGDHKCADYCSDRTHSLHPSSCVISGPLPEHQGSSPADNKRPRSGNCNFQQCAGFEADFLGKHQWLLAIIQSVIVNNSKGTVHGGFA